MSRERTLHSVNALSELLPLHTASATVRIPNRCRHTGRRISKREPFRPLLSETGRHTTPSRFRADYVSKAKLWKVVHSEVASIMGVRLAFDCRQHGSKFLLLIHAKAHQVGYSPCLTSCFNQLSECQLVGCAVIEFLLEKFTLEEIPIRQGLTPVPQSRFGIASASTLRVERLGVGYDRHAFFSRTRVPVEVFAPKEYRMDCDCSLDLAQLLLEVGMTPTRFHNGGDQR